jgi:hypothetical protein
MISAVKKALPLIGGIASIAALGWVAFLAWEQRGAIADIGFPLGAAVLYAAFYALSLTMLASNWADIVDLFDGRGGAPARLLRSSFLKSQAWKYLPGNVFHYVSRHVAGARGGASSGALFKATLCESAALVAAALLVSATALLASDLALPEPWGTRLLVLMGAAIPLSAIALWASIRIGREPLPIGRAMLVLARAVLFMAALGGFACLVVGDFSNAGAIIGATTLAWVVGFLSPGSPGGLGTREAVFVFLLAPVLGEPLVLGASLVLRAITFAGDLLASALGVAIERTGRGN